MVYLFDNKELYHFCRHIDCEEKLLFFSLFLSISSYYGNINLQSGSIESDH